MPGLKALAPLSTLLVILTIVALLPHSAAQQGVGWSGQAVVSPGPVLLLLTANVSSAPVTLSIPVCGNATGYWAYEGSEPLPAYLANGSLNVPVLQQGLVNVTVVESGCARQAGAVYEAWVYMPGPGLIRASNGTTIVYFEGNATPLGPQELVSGGGNVTVFLAVNKTATGTATSTITLVTTSTSTATVTTSALESQSTSVTTSNGTASVVSRTTSASASTVTSSATTQTKATTSSAGVNHGSGAGLLDSVATVIVLIMVAAVVVYLVARGK